jgi:hypothetical protein
MGDCWFLRSSCGAELDKRHFGQEVLPGTATRRWHQSSCAISFLGRSFQHAVTSHIACYSWLLVLWMHSPPTSHKREESLLPAYSGTAERAPCSPPSFIHPGTVAKHCLRKRNCPVYFGGKALDLLGISTISGRTLLPTMAVQRDRRRDAFPSGATFCAWTHYVRLAALALPLPPLNLLKFSGGCWRLGGAATVNLALESLNSIRL